MTHEPLKPIGKEISDMLGRGLDPVSAKPAQKTKLPKLIHTRTDCSAHDLIIGGKNGLACANCGAEKE